MRKSGLILLLLLSAKLGFGQQDPQISHYMFNPVFFNPAFSGSEGNTRITALHRTQWLGYQPSFDEGGAPSTQLLTFSSPLPGLSSGIGGYISNDRLGPLNNLEVQGTYAWYKRLGSGLLSAGVKAGFYSQTIDFAKYRPVNPGDPLINSKGKVSQVKPDLGFGLRYRTEKFYAGVSLNHALQSTFDLGLNQRSKLQPTLYFTGGYFYEVNFDLRLQLMTLIKSDLTKTAIDFGGIAYLRDTMWGGISFRESEAAILMFGYSLLKDKSLKIGYSLDYIIQDQAAKQPTSHEIMLAYELPVSTSVQKKIVRTPRYRH